MKKRRNILISLVLCLSVLLSLNSCKYVNNAVKYIKQHYIDNKDQSDHPQSCSCYPNPPEGYTGGFRLMPSTYDYTEIHWVETYEEAMVAIEHLEAAGNQIYKAVLSSYENDNVDAKYAFKLNLTGCKHLEEGKAWYDREQCMSVTVTYFGFLENITIEELEYSDSQKYKYVALGSARTEFTTTDDMSYACIQCGNVENEYWGYQMEMSEYEMCFAVKNSFSGPTRAVNIIYHKIENHTETLPENFHEDFVKTLVRIGDKDR